MRWWGLAVDRLSGGFLPGVLLLTSVLIGGYFGSWVPAAAIGGLVLSNEALARHGGACVMQTP